ncbi:MAG: DUF1858 domain-containing protein [Spirochaetes bacterium]|nr:DUF1858 domain-containing protein [Spirochaetota bacterium]
MEDKFIMAENIKTNMTFGEILKKFPKSGQIMAKYGLHCIGCHIAVTETLAEGATAHGFSSEKLKQLVDELNTSAV